MTVVFENYFDLFCLPQQYAIDEAVLQSRYYRLQEAMHPDKLVNKLEAEKKVGLLYSAQISAAYKVLSDSFERAKYLLNCRDKSWEDKLKNQALPMETLMDQMALREELETLRADKASDDWQSFKDKIAAQLADLMNALPCLDEPNTSEEVILTILQQIPFYQKLATAIEDEETACHS